MRQPSLILLALALIPTAGCGSGAKIATVSGKVTLNGTALPNAHVAFEPKARAADGTVGVSSYALTDSEGRYSLKTFDEATGAIVGVHRVRITLPDEEEAASDAGSTKPINHTIPARYRDGSQEFTVESGGHTDADFDIQTP